MEPDFALSCCSTVDLPRETLLSRGVSFLPFHFTLDGKEYADDLGASLSYPDFYRALSAGASVSTSQPNPSEFLAHFEPILQKGQNVLHLSLSSGLSGAYRSALSAKAELEAKYPGQKVECIDSLGASSGSGLLLLLAADRRDQGASLNETKDFLLRTRLRVHHWFFSTDLSWYVRGGRLSRREAVIGTALGIVPLLKMDPEGHLVPVRKYHGTRRAIREIVQRMVRYAQDGPRCTGPCFLSQSGCPDLAEEVKKEIERRFPALDQPIQIFSVGTTIGSHTGPGTVALYFVGAEERN